VAETTGLAVRDVQRRAEAVVREGLADRLVHVCERDQYDPDAGEYTPPSLDEEGVVHLSTPAQVVAVARRHHREAVDPVLLVVDPDRVSPPLRYEEERASGYAHLCGPLNTDAVVDVTPLPREDGQYVLPNGFGE